MWIKIVITEKRLNLCDIKHLNQTGKILVSFKLPIAFMISIIISTNHQERLKNISDDIKKTIGKIDYEIIDIFNPKRYSLCEAYNIGVEKSKYHYLCFVHDDVIFRTNNWGERLVDLFENDPQIGLVGVVEINSNPPIHLP